MKTTAKLSFMMFVEWFIWGAWFVPLWLWLSKAVLVPEKLAGRMPVPPLRRSCRQFWLAPSLTAFSRRKKCWRY
ncbi:major facilitator superfamily protein [Escherichia coli]|uniref:Major facilitator superfamily protein n=1 Tax=Escherichia coli TaxID=562 RepID=A0A2X3JKQ7_ECOLX|nr:major facilitator superfamily protein [Escherichia coli]